MSLFHGPPLVHTQLGSSRLRPPYGSNSCRCATRPSVCTAAVMLKFASWVVPARTIVKRPCWKSPGHINGTITAYKCADHPFASHACDKSIVRVVIGPATPQHAIFTLAWVRVLVRVLRQRKFAEEEGHVGEVAAVFGAVFACGADEEEAEAFDLAVLQQAVGDLDGRFDRLGFEL